MEFQKTFAIYNDISHDPFNKIYFIIMSQPINPPTKVSLWSSDMSDAERLAHERLLLVFKEANETFNGAIAYFLA